MNYITYTKNMLAFALIGTVSAGTLFGFWFNGAELELIRAIGAILFIIVSVIFFQDIPHSQIIKNEKKQK